MHILILRKSSNFQKPILLSMPDEIISNCLKYVKWSSFGSEFGLLQYLEKNHLEKEMTDEVDR